MTYTEVETAVRDWIIGIITSDPVIFANENGPRPALPYVTINILVYTKIGHAWKSETVAVDGIQTIKYDEDFTISIQGFGAGSNDLLQSLKDSLQKDSVIDALHANGLATRDEANITENSITIDRTVEKRWLFEVFMGFAQEITETVGWIETAEVNPTVNPPK